ncbi:MAG: transporter substrate-binding domain-containing protein [Pseudohongiella sp.]|nr:transporter substrate-binding domain-containing protein [Pseudohongiella sp.]MDP2126451.1 transporter substrate-binding domain-containing protein [Pseudohongiella sp.]
MIPYYRLSLTCLLCTFMVAGPLCALGQPEADDDHDLPAIIRVCVDETGFPPFSYDLPENRGRVVGFNVDLLTMILDDAGVRAEYQMIPWRRCLAMAESGEVDVLLDVQDSAERQRLLLIPASHYETRAAMLATARNRDLMQIITTKERLLALDVCRMPGWDTSSVVPASELIPAGEPHNLAAAVTMLRLGRCDLVIYTAELFTGGLHSGAITPDDVEGINIYVVPWVQEKVPKFFGISRQAPAAQAIYNLLDSSIKELHANGELARLLSLYLPSE